MARLEHELLAVTGLGVLQGTGEGTVRSLSSTIRCEVTRYSTVPYGSSRLIESPGSRASMRENGAPYVVRCPAT